MLSQMLFCLLLIAGAAVRLDTPRDYIPVRVAAYRIFLPGRRPACPPRYQLLYTMLCCLHYTRNK